MALLKLDELEISFNGGSPVVGPIGLAVDAGDFVAIVGESGSGKTLTVHSLIDVLPPTFRNRIGGSFRGVPFGRELARKIRGREISIVFQDPGSYFQPRWKVRKILSEVVPGRTKRAAESVLGDLMESVELGPETLQKFPFQLSGGMLQRVALAKALAVSPSILLADEITSALDHPTRDQILRLLREQAVQRGTGVVLVSHDLPAVAKFVDRVYVMYAGRIVEEGPAGAIFETPRHPYTRMLVDAAPSGDRKGSRLSEIAGSPPAAGKRPNGCPFAPRCSRADGRCSTMPDWTVRSTHGFRCWNPVEVP